MGFWPSTVGFCYRPWALPDFCILISTPTISLSGLYYHTLSPVVFFRHHYSLGPYSQEPYKRKTIWMDKGSCTLNLLSRSFSFHHSITTSFSHFTSHSSHGQSYSHLYLNQAGTGTQPVLKDHPHYWQAKATPPPPNIHPLVLNPLSLSLWTVERKVRIDRCQRPTEDKGKEEGIL